MDEILIKRNSQMKPKFVVMNIFFGVQKWFLSGILEGMHKTLQIIAQFQNAGLQLY